MLHATLFRLLACNVQPTHEVRTFDFTGDGKLEAEKAGVGGAMLAALREGTRRSAYATTETRYSYLLLQSYYDEAGGARMVTTASRARHDDRAAHYTGS